jgi:transposase
MHADEDGVRIEACCSGHTGVCPGCEQASERVHSRYRRTLADAPIGARAVVIGLRVRRFFCDNTECVRRTFAEQVAGLTSRQARRTGVSRGLLEAVGVALGGRAGARLASVLGMPVSRDSLLRLVRALPDPPVGAVEVLGVDDFAVRRNHSYGTVMVDILGHRPVDLVEERTAEVLADWLGRHPGVQVICRDRSGAYAEGARVGAPGAIQVADRYHLWANLGEAVERTVLAHRGCLREAVHPDQGARPATDSVSPGRDAADDSGGEKVAPARELSILTRTRERYEEVSRRRERGESISAISRTLGLDRRTVRRFASASGLEELQAKTMQRASLVDGFTDYLHQRWSEGATDAAALTKEITALGYRGSEQTVRRYLHPLRAGRPAPPARPVPPTVREVTGWMLRHPERLEPEEQVRLKQVLAHCPHLDAAATHVKAFAAMMGQLTGKEQLPGWLDAVAADDLPALHSLVAGLRRDQDAVTNGLSLPYSSGQVEGTVTKIKYLKRQMFGRANFDLLRKRVLAW